MLPGFSGQRQGLALMGVSVFICVTLHKSPPGLNCDWGTISEAKNLYHVCEG